MKNVPIKYTKLFIDNKWVDAVSGRTFPTLNPQDESVITQIAEGDKADIDKAVEAAKRAFHRYSEWRSIDASKRGHVIYKLADLLERDSQYVAELETLDSGKPLSMSLYEVQFAINVLRYYAGKADKITGHSIPADGEVISITVKEPVGICGQIIPWNYPLTMAVWKVAPALAAGCCIVLKPAEQTPLSALVLASLAMEAGLPKGVLNIVNGFGPKAGAAITSHPDIDKIAFTGSTEVGKMIIANSPKANIKRITMELGGKSGLVIFDDANLDMAALVATRAVFSNQGQCCAAGSRTYVQAGIYDNLISKCVEIANKRKIGNSFDPEVEHGPQIDKGMFDKILNYIDIGKKCGARLAAGGERFGNKGFYIKPTIFSDVTDDMRIAREEIFGPVQCILKFNTFEEIVDRVNDSNYGLGAGIITNNLNTALAFSKYVRAGTIWVNTFLHFSPQSPFGGYKESGFGRELGEEGIWNYLETKTITISLPHQIK